MAENDDVYKVYLLYAASIKILYQTTFVQYFTEISIYEQIKENGKI
jgi:hypothetical protein